METIIKFKCIPDKCVCNNDNFKVYGCLVDSFIYPDIKINKYGNCTINGGFQELHLGIEYTVDAIEELNKFGYAYKVKNIRREKPTDLESSRKFLYEILSDNQADTLLNVYPNIIDKIMKNDLSDINLSKTKGIKEYTFGVIKRKVIESFKLFELVDEFKGIFSISILNKLYEKYPSIDKIKEVLKEKPYDCLCGLSRIGFKIADSLLLSADESKVIKFEGELKSSYQRCKACVNYVLDDNENNGNTYLDVKNLKKQAEILVPEAIHNLPKILKEDKSIVFDKERLVVSKVETYKAEEYIKNRVLEGLNINTKWDCNHNNYKSLQGFNLTDMQAKTSQYMCEYNIAILNGFGGSGKSSSSKALINMLDDYRKSSLLIAPTGRASKVLSAYTRKDAKTIHRGLLYNPKDGTWEYNEENKLDVDIVIIDEFSMVDIFLFVRLLEAIDFDRTKMLIIGDSAQIPSVSAGNCLHDLLHSKLIPTITLDKVFRYGTGGLSTVATDIRLGTQYLDKSKNGVQVFGEDKSYMFMSIDQSKIVDYSVKVYKQMLEKGYKKEEVVILSSYNKGEYGTTEINKRLQNEINPTRKRYLTYGDTEFRLNDIVINCANDYKAQLWNAGSPTKENVTFVSNGDIGTVIDVLSDGLVIAYDDMIVYTEKEKLSNIKLGYSISIHKSQGGQFKVVILLTPKAHTYMLNSNLLYVGVSRAIEICFHLGDIPTVNRALGKKENFDRKTLLPTMLKQTI